MACLCLHNPNKVQKGMQTVEILRTLLTLQRHALVGVSEEYEIIPEIEMTISGKGKRGGMIWGHVEDRRYYSTQAWTSGGRTEYHATLARLSGNSPPSLPETEPSPGQGPIPRSTRPRAEPGQGQVGKLRHHTDQLIPCVYDGGVSLFKL